MFATLSLICCFTSLYPSSWGLTKFVSLGLPLCGCLSLSLLAFKKVCLNCSRPYSPPHSWKVLLWWCMERSTKDPEEAVFTTGALRLLGARQEVVWTGVCRIMHVPPKWGTGVVATQPQSNPGRVGVGWGGQICRIFKWSPNRHFLCKVYEMLTTYTNKWN